MSDEPKLSQRYRELPREEPPRALDDAILAASRRAVRRRRWWYGPVAAAAVIILAIAVVLHVDREQPDNETFTAQAPVPQAQQPAAVEEPKAEAPKPQRRAEARQRAAKPASPQFTPDPQAEQRERADLGAASAPAPMAKPAPNPLDAGAVIASRPAPAPLLRSQLYMDTPERELERIAELRRLGRHGEADKALAEFRKRYPDYRLSEETKAKVEKAQ